MKQLQQSLTREQERALHWQQLYLSERRQRERDREEEELEDERDRERWEQEREQSDQLECLQKLVSTNLTTLTQHVLRWNVSVFDDFANLSMLMSTVADLKQSVISSAHKVWEEAEEVFEQIGDSVQKKSKYSREKWESLPNKDELLTYFEQVMKDVKEEVEDVFKDKADSDNNKSKSKGDFSDGFKKSKNYGGTRKRIGRFSNLIKKTKVSVKKLGKKLVGFLGKMQDAWENRQKWFSKVGDLFHNVKKSPIESKFNDLCIGSKDALVRSDGDFLINVLSQCMSFIRLDWQKNIFDNECSDGECYKHSKNPLENSKHLASELENLLKTKNLRSKDIGFLNAKYSSNMKFMFGDFVAKWSSSNLVLGIDMAWAKCQHEWWKNAHLFILKNKKQNKESVFRENNCKWVKLPDKTFTDDMTSLELLSALQYRLFSNNQQERNGHNENHYTNDDRNDYDDKTTAEHQPESDDRPLVLEISPPEKLGDNAKHFNLHQVDDNKTKFRSQPHQEGPDRLSLERARSHLEAKRSKEKSMSLSSNKDGNFDSNILQKNSDRISGEWQFKKSNERELKRKEEHQSDWMFERAQGRRDVQQNPSRGSDDSTYTIYKTPSENNQENWYVGQGKDRENLRKLDHQSDWMFERAYDRANHRDSHKENKREKRSYKKEKSYDKRFKGNKNFKDSRKCKGRSNSISCVEF